MGTQLVGRRVGDDWIIIKGLISNHTNKRFSNTNTLK